MNTLKRLRNAANLSQRELAEVLGIGQNSISNYEKGLRVPDTEKLKFLAEYFNVSIDYLLGNIELDDNKMLLTRLEMKILYYLRMLNEDKQHEFAEMIIKSANEQDVQ